MITEKLKKKIEKFNKLNAKWGNICTPISIENGSVVNGGINPANCDELKINFIQLLWRTAVLEIKCNSIYRKVFKL